MHNEIDTRLGDLWAKHGGTLQPDSAEATDLFIFDVSDDSRGVRYGCLSCALPTPFTVPA